jgi:hypothetical protein
MSATHAPEAHRLSWRRLLADGGWLLIGGRPRTRSTAGPDPIVFAVDRVALITLGLLAAVCVLFALFAGLSALRPSLLLERTAPGANGARVATLLRSPRAPVNTVGPRATPTAFGMVAPGGPDLALLVDGWASGDIPYWTSSSGQLPVDLQFTAGERPRGRLVPILAGRALFGNSLRAPRETWPKDVEIWTSLSPDLSNPTLLARWTLAQTAEPQIFSFSRRPVWSVWLRILSTHAAQDPLATQDAPTAPDTTLTVTLAEFALLTPPGG